MPLAAVAHMPETLHALAPQAAGGDHDTPFAMYDAARLNAQHIAACAIDALGRGDLSALERVVRA